MGAEVPDPAPRRRGPRRADAPGTGPASADAPEPRLPGVGAGTVGARGAEGVRGAAGEPTADERDRWLLEQRPPHWG
ncbi:hypothetical protein ACIPJU_04630 [Micrococcus endophyticus]|uniref:hypothetical protein n=1 Tax=Micrococcus endophyticus TaxID=455343 RepID=UPI00381C6FCA